MQRRALLAEWMERARLLLDFLPADVWGLGGTDIVRMLHRALARWKVDTGEPVSAGELSLLSGNPKKIQTLLGHSSINMTMDVYGHLFENAEEDAAMFEKLESDLLAA